MAPSSSPTPSWRPGQVLSPGGRTKLVVVAGAGSRTGDAERAFASLAAFLARSAGYVVRRDVLEATYAGAEVDGRWKPRPYTSADTRASLEAGAAGVAGTLEWYRASLPENSRFCVLGYSLGGVVGLDGATLAVARDRAGWRGRLAAVITFSSPLRGSDAETFLRWAWLGTADQQGLGDAGTALVQRWKDPRERARLERRVAFLRAQGTNVLTFADPDDAVVRPSEALVLQPGQLADDLLVRANVGGSANLGHGGLLQEPAVWRRVLTAIGPQDMQPRVPDTSIEDEMRAIKERLRAEGRLH